MHLRPVTASDQGFVRAVYAGTREQELALAGWDAAGREAFVNLQFKAQNDSYLGLYPAACHQVIELDGQAVGRLWVNHGPCEIRLLDISLLPAWRAQGLGTLCLRQLQQLAQARQVSLRLHVEAGNPAHRLYRRLGLVATDLHGMHIEMTWHAASANDRTQPLEICNEQA